MLATDDLTREYSCAHMVFGLGTGLFKSAPSCAAVMLQSHNI